jgi:death-on-curing protein
VTLKFLTTEAVIEIHRLQLSHYGGSGGIRDRKLLDSALAQPMASFGGRYLHRDVFTMAAAYLFHIVLNHPFVDGNKRVGLHAALTFLALNGHPLEVPSEDLYSVTMAVARGRLGKDAVARLFRRLASRSGRAK